MPDGRINNGGARPGAGRPHKEQEINQEELFAEAIPRERRLLILRVMGSKAASGDIGATRFVWEYMYGKPKQPLPDEGDGSEGKPAPPRRLIIEG